MQKEKEYWPWPKVELEPEFEPLTGGDEEDLCSALERPIGERLCDAFILTEGEAKDLC